MPSILGSSEVAWDLTSKPHLPASLCTLLNKGRIAASLKRSQKGAKNETFCSLIFLPNVFRLILAMRRLQWNLQYFDRINQYSLLAHVVSTLAWSLSQAATMNAPPCSDLRSPTFPRTSSEPGREMRTHADSSRRCGYDRLDRQEGRSYGRILVNAIPSSGRSMVAADETVVLRYSGRGAESAGSSACADTHYRPRCAPAAGESDIGVAANVPPSFSPGVEELKSAS